MKQKKSRKEVSKVRWIDVALILFILIGGIIIINMEITYKSENGQCLREPFVYGSEQLEKNYKEKVGGVIFIENYGSTYFNSTGMTAGETWQTLSKP